MSINRHSTDPFPVKSRYLEDWEKSYIEEQVRSNVGCNLSSIANYLNRDRSTVSRYVKKNCLVVKKEEDEVFLDPVQKKMGRPSKVYDINIAEKMVKEFIIQKKLQNNFVQSAEQIRAFMVKHDLCDQKTSVLTIRRFLKKIRIKFKRIHEFPYLTQQQKDYRVKTALYNQLVDYKNVIFSDESMFRLKEVKTRGWLPDSEEPTREQYHKSNGGIMVWAAFSYYGYCPLQVFPQEPGKPGTTKNIDSRLYKYYLSRTLPDIMNCHPPESSPMFLQDNAAIHKSKSTLNYINKKKWTLISHPPYSPDLNPIEKVWATMKHHLKEETDNFKSPATLAEAAKDEWKKLMSNEQYRRKLCYRYREVNMCCVKNGGDFVLDSDLDKFRTIMPTPKNF